MDGRRLLVVDDHPVNRSIVRVLLRGSSWTCDEVANGFDAIEMLNKQKYDCVLLDISMPDMSGEEVCHRIRMCEHLRPLRVIAYTAHAMEEELQQILAAGFNALLTKPISKAALLEQLAQV